MRLRIRITGAVQGVGFRPHVYRLAVEAGLSGFVLNSAQGVCIEAQGEAAAVRGFAERLQRCPPANAVVASFDTEPLQEQAAGPFEVRSSDASGEPAAYLLPDLAVCPACLADIRTPGNRRYRYPFTSCTHCGPRYSIVEGLPYDRPLTSMRRFPLCAACAAEYRDPSSRRFHAQTNCCPECGPQIELRSPAGQRLHERHDALLAAAQAVREGKILAFKGIGGFHLICDARNRAALEELRRRKRRPTKPFAVMLPDHPEPLLHTPQSPIVLVDNDAGLPPEVAPGNPLLGVMIPYSPLHALLLDELRGPVVATSGNLTDEPICTGNAEALERLRGVADLFLLHDRPILRPVDDSIVRYIGGQPVLLRRARGYAPLPVEAPAELPEMIATGAHMKNTVAFSRGRRVFLSQHLGDLSTLPALDSHRRALADLTRTYRLKPQAVACDLHPDYGSTRTAHAMGLPVQPVQHHAAHLFAGLLEHRIEAPLLAVCWDGSGWGGDGTVWGGEFLLWDGRRVWRPAHLRPFPLPGAEQAVREPRRSLLGVLSQFGAEELARPLFSAVEWRLLRRMMERKLNTPMTTSAGRLFDAAAALLGLCAVASFEGEAAMALEFSARDSTCQESAAAGTDWQPLFERLARSPLPAPDRAAMFHNSLVDAIVQTAGDTGVERVLLTGGCFQNALLAGKAAARLRAAGHTVFTHRLLPPNDGAIAAGQILAAALEAPPCA